MKAPSANIQAPEKQQAPSLNDNGGGFGYWNLALLWRLVLGMWSF
jgi:hypothetical protein